MELTGTKPSPIQSTLRSGIALASSCLSPLRFEANHQEATKDLASKLPLKLQNFKRKICHLLLGGAILWRCVIIITALTNIEHASYNWHVRRDQNLYVLLILITLT
jgi:hypothetical protein